MRKYLFVCYWGADNPDESYPDYFVNNEAAINALPNELREAVPEITKILLWALDENGDLLYCLDAATRGE